MLSKEVLDYLQLRRQIKMKINENKIKRWSKFGFFLAIAGVCFYAGYASAQEATTIGKVAEHITGSFKQIGKLMFAVSYLAGFGFVIAGIFKFKQHKDNPTQIPMGTPIAMVLIGVALIFLPSMIGPAGRTIFETPKAGGFAGGGASVIPGGSETPPAQQ